MIDRYNDYSDYIDELMEKKGKRSATFTVVNKNNFNEKDFTQQEKKDKEEAIKEVNTGDFNTEEGEEDVAKLAKEIVRDAIGSVNKRVKERQRLNVREATFSDVPKRFKSPEQAMKFVKSKGDELVEDFEPSKQEYGEYDFEPTFADDTERKTYEGLREFEKMDKDITEVAKTRTITVDDLIGFMSHIMKSSTEEAKKKYDSDPNEKKHIDEVVKQYNEKSGNPMTKKIKEELLTEIHKTHNEEIPDDVKKLVQNMTAKQFFNYLKKEYRSESKAIVPPKNLWLLKTTKMICQRIITQK